MFFCAFSAPYGRGWWHAKRRDHVCAPTHAVVFLHVPIAISLHKWHCSLHCTILLAESNPSNSSISAWWFAKVPEKILAFLARLTKIQQIPAF